MLTNAPILAIVPTTDITRAKAFYGETLGLTDANVSTPGPQVFYRCGGGTLLEVYERRYGGSGATHPCLMGCGRRAGRRQ
jgi:predicted enzyme related to lactoylglutathione lyase